MRPFLLLSLLAGCAGGSRSAYIAAPPGYPGGAQVAVAETTSGEDYHDWGKNPWVVAEHDHLSTFAADVDTASYTIARRKLEEGVLPPPESVRVEEWVNYFKYAFPAPNTSSPFSVVMDAAPHPFEAGRYVLRVGVATKAKTPGERKPSHLVFLVDVSGSMASPDKLELAKQALHILTDNLTEKDSVSIVTYAGDTRLVLPMTSIDHKDKISRTSKRAERCLLARSRASSCAPMAMPTLARIARPSS
jgi:Ca-activated chloride channel family protein